MVYIYRDNTCLVFTTTEEDTALDPRATFQEGSKQGWDEQEEEPTSQCSVTTRLGEWSPGGGAATGRRWPVNGLVCHLLPLTHHCLGQRTL